MVTLGYWLGGTARREGIAAWQYLPASGKPEQTLIQVNFKALKNIILS